MVSNRPQPARAAESDAAVAAEAGLRYTSDDRPGIRRLRRGRGFTYVDTDRQTVTSKTARARIDGIVIPPAWTDVWISPDPRGHIQATGRDARGRKQYRYHPRWRTVRDANKFERLADFGAALPTLRRQVKADLKRPGLPREKAVALVVNLLDETLIRIGNSHYAETNGSYGLTTMRVDHVEIDRSTIEFNFVGKSGLDHRVLLDDRHLARMVQRCSELGGQELFVYRDGDSIGSVDSSAVNGYLDEHMGNDATSKDFRTWGGTCAAGGALVMARETDDDRDIEQQIIGAIDVAAEVLGNTRNVCRNCYVHPAVLVAHRDGDLQEHWRQARGRPHLNRAERMVLSILADNPPSNG